MSWRVLATLITFGFAYLWLGDVAQSGALAIATNATKFGLYFAHERIWSKVRWGYVRAS